MFVLQVFFALASIMELLYEPFNKKIIHRFILFTRKILQVFILYAIDRYIISHLTIFWSCNIYMKGNRFEETLTLYIQSFYTLLFHSVTFNLFFSVALLFQNYIVTLLLVMISDWAVSHYISSVQLPKSEQWLCQSMERGKIFQAVAQSSGMAGGSMNSAVFLTHPLEDSLSLHFRQKEPQQAEAR